MAYNGNIYIYLFIIQISKSRHRGVGTHQRQGNREEGKTSEKRAEKMKGIVAQRMKIPTPSWQIDALLGDEEQN